MFTEQNLEFQEKILERSGLGDETGLSDGIAAMKDGDVKTTLRAALEESEMVLYDVVEDLLAKTNTDPQEVKLILMPSCAFPLSLSHRQNAKVPYDSRDFPLSCSTEVQHLHLAGVIAWILVCTVQHEAALC